MSVYISTSTIEPYRIEFWCKVILYSECTIKKYFVGLPSFSPSFLTASVYIFARGGGGGDCKQHGTVMRKNAKLYNVQEPVR